MHGRLWLHAGMHTYMYAHVSLAGAGTVGSLGCHLNNQQEHTAAGVDYLVWGQLQQETQMFHLELISCRKLSEAAPANADHVN